MPLQGTYSSWEQNKEKVFLTIPLKGVSVSKVDITLQGFVLKVNFVPYLLDITLSHEIDTLRHKATVNKKGELRIELFKKEANVQWTSLEAEGDTEELQKKRLDSSLVDEALNKDLQAQRADAKLAEEKYSLRKQMALDEAERNRLDQLKQEEKQQAEQEVYQTFSEMERLREAEKTKKTKGGSGGVGGGGKKAAVHFEEPSAATAAPTPAAASASAAASTSSKASKSLYDIDDEEDDNVDETPETADDVKVSDCDATRSSSSSSSDGKNIFNLPAAKSETQIRSETDMTSTAAVDDEEEEDVRYVPPPRNMSNSSSSGGDESAASASAGAKVSISFTPRAFPTPMRESKAAEEEDWVARNRKHLKKHGVLGKNITNNNNSSSDVSEEDPQWLKAKGDDFTRYGDYRSAVNAYSAALEADNSMAACYSNRSICYLKMNMFAECVSDCSAAIELLLPACQPTDRQNAHTVTAAYTSTTKVVKLLVRRGAAQAQLGDFSSAVVDHREAASLLSSIEAGTALLRKTRVDKDDLSGVLAEGWLAGLMKDVTRSSIEEDTAKLETLRDADALKKEGDAHFAAGDLAAALLKYNEVLAAVPVHVACLANRSAVRMAQKDYKGCIDDCTTAIDLMNSSNSSSSSGVGGSSMLETILPAAGEKRSSWQVKTLLRRGVALSQMALLTIDGGDAVRCLDEAVRDYSSAVALDPKNETLKADLNKLMTFRESKRKEIVAATSGGAGGLTQ